MKPIIEYLINSHVKQPQIALTIEDICNIFKGELVNAGQIKHCEVAECTFYNKHAGCLQDKTLSLLIYCNDNYDKENPDMLFVMWNGNYEIIKDYLLTFRNAVNNQKQIVSLNTKIYCDKTHVLQPEHEIMFSRSDNKYDSIFLFKPKDYKDLEVNKII